MKKTIYVLLDMSDKSRKIIEVFENKDKAEEKRLAIAKERGIADYYFVIDEFEVKDSAS